MARATQSDKTIREIAINDWATESEKLNQRNCHKAWVMEALRKSIRKRETLFSACL